MKNLSHILLAFIFTTQSFAQEMMMLNEPPPNSKPPTPSSGGATTDDKKGPTPGATASGSGGGAQGTQSGAKLEQIDISKYKNAGACSFGSDINEDDRKLLKDSLDTIKALKNACADDSDQGTALQDAITKFQKLTGGNSPQNSEDNVTVTCGNYKQLYNQDYNYFTANYAPPAAPSEPSGMMGGGEPGMGGGGGGEQGMGMGAAATSPFAACNTKTSLEEAMKCAGVKLSEITATKEKACLKYNEATKIQEKNDLIAKAATEVTDAINNAINQDCHDDTKTPSEQQKQRRLSFLGGVAKFVGKAASIVVGPIGGLAVGGLSDVIQNVVKKAKASNDTVGSLMDSMNRKEDFDKVACLYEQIEKKNFRCDNLLATKQLKGFKDENNKCPVPGGPTQGFDQFYTGINSIVDQVKKDVEEDNKIATTKKKFNFDEKYKDHEGAVSGMMKDLSDQMNGEPTIGPDKMTFSTFMSEVSSKNANMIQAKLEALTKEGNEICKKYPKNKDCAEFSYEAQEKPKVSGSNTQSVVGVKAPAGGAPKPEPAAIPGKDLEKILKLKRDKVEATRLLTRNQTFQMINDPISRGEVASDAALDAPKTGDDKSPAEPTTARGLVFQRLMDIQKKNNKDSFHLMVKDVLEIQKSEKGGTYKDVIDQFENDHSLSVSFLAHQRALRSLTDRKEAKFNDDGSFRDMHQALRVPLINQLKVQLDGTVKAIQDEFAKKDHNDPSLINSEASKTARKTFIERDLRKTIRMCSKLRSSLSMNNQSFQSEKFDLGIENDANFACNMFKCAKGMSAFPDFLKQNGYPASLNQSSCSDGNCPQVYMEYVCSEGDRMGSVENSLMNEFKNSGTICGKKAQDIASNVKGIDSGMLKKLIPTEKRK